MKVRAKNRSFLEWHNQGWIVRRDIKISTNLSVFLGGEGSRSDRLTFY